MNELPNTRFRKEIIKVSNLALYQLSYRVSADRDRTDNLSINSRSNSLFATFQILARENLKGTFFDFCSTN